MQLWSELVSTCNAVLHPASALVCGELEALPALLWSADGP